MDDHSSIPAVKGVAGRAAGEAAYADLLIIDDILPCGFSPSRTIEYGHYLSFFDTALLSLQGWHLWAGNETFDEQLAALPIDPGLKSRVLPFAAGARISARLAYVTFAGNAVRLLPYLESRNLPFILQLYPGGAFAIDQPETNKNSSACLAFALLSKSDRDPDTHSRLYPGQAGLRRREDRAHLRRRIRRPDEFRFTA